MGVAGRLETVSEGTCVPCPVGHGSYPRVESGTGQWHGPNLTWETLGSCEVGTGGETRLWGPWLWTVGDGGVNVTLLCSRALTYPGGRPWP